MAEFKITRFRYTWQGEWDTSVTTYYKDDVVHYNGSAWVCIRQHSPSTFNADQIYTVSGETSPSPAWTKMSDGRKWAGDWAATTLYEPGSIVYAGGNLYLCTASHTSASNFNTDSANWDLLAVGSNFRNEWNSAQRYKVGDVIRYNGYTYICTTEHLSLIHI